MKTKTEQRFIDFQKNIEFYKNSGHMILHRKGETICGIDIALEGLFDEDTNIRAVAYMALKGFVDRDVSNKIKQYLKEKDFYIIRDGEEYRERNILVTLYRKLLLDTVTAVIKNSKGTVGDYVLQKEVESSA